MSDVILKCRKNGPLLVDGKVTVLDSDGKAVESDSGKALVALCRCGHSEKKPFCDGSHHRRGWQE